MSMFDEIMKNKDCQEILKEISDNEKPFLLDALRKFVEEFETNLVEPLKKSVE